jgi:hypothetical protein
MATSQRNWYNVKSSTLNGSERGGPLIEPKPTSETDFSPVPVRCLRSRIDKKYQTIHDFSQLNIE